MDDIAPKADSDSRYQAEMKDFNDGPSLGSTVLTALRAFETAALTF
jgi:hypothetical protein